MCALSHAHSRMQCSSEVGSHSRSDSDNDVKTEGSAFRIDPESERKSNKNKQTNAHSLIHAHMHTYTHIYRHQQLIERSNSIKSANSCIIIHGRLSLCQHHIPNKNRMHTCGRASERARASRTHKNRALEKWKRMNAEMWNRCSDVCVHVFQIDLQAEMRAYSSAAAAAATATGIYTRTTFIILLMPFVQVNWNDECDAFSHTHSKR